MSLTATGSLQPLDQSQEAELFGYRHLMQDLMKLLPHSKKDVKVDLKDGVGQVNDIADMEVTSNR